MSRPRAFHPAFFRTPAILVIILLVSLIAWGILPPAHTHAEDPQKSHQDGNTRGESSSHTVVINFVGDILLASGVGDLIKSQGVMAPWEGVKDILASSDFTIGNLECAVGTKGQPVANKTYTFRAAPETLEGLRQSGFDVVSLANNHALDYGVECMLETIDNVKKYGMVPLGAGATEKEARAYTILEKNGVKIGVLATGAVIPEVGWAAKGAKAGLAVDYSQWHSQIKSSIEELRKKVDSVVVYVHWGEERKTAPEDWVLKLDKALREAGANIVIGSHPHVLRGFFYDGQSLCAYSLGNFVFTTRPDFPLCQMGAILRVTLSKKGIEKVEVLPTKIVWGRTVLMEGQERKDALTHLASLTRPLGADISPWGQVSEMPFKDIKDHWARFAVSSLAHLGIVSGYTDSTFMPERKVTRGELAKLLASFFFEDQASKEPPPGKEGQIPIPKDHWSYPYLSLLADKGVLRDPAGPNPSTSQPSTTAPTTPRVFDADSPATRKETCLWLYRIMNLETGHPEQKPSRFSDLKGLSPEELEAVNWCSHEGIVVGYDNSVFGPENPLTRAEIATILWRVLGHKGLK